MLRGRKRHRPEARERQQEEADRPVEAGEPEIGQDRRRREAVDQIARARVGNGAGFALGQRTCHVMARVIGCRGNPSRPR